MYAAYQNMTPEEQRVRLLRVLYIQNIPLIHFINHKNSTNLVVVLYSSFWDQSFNYTSDRNSFAMNEMALAASYCTCSIMDVFWYIILIDWFPPRPWIHKLFQRPKRIFYNLYFNLLMGPKRASSPTTQKKSISAFFNTLIQVLL